MTDDFRQLLRGAADEAPETLPDVVSQGLARGRAIRRRRTALVTGSAALLCATTVVTTFALARGDDAGKGRPAPAAPSTSLPVQVEDGELLVGCGGSDGWPASVMSEGLPGVVTAPEMTETFEQILQDPRYAGEAELSLFPDGADAVEWRVLRSDDDTLTLGLGGWSDQGPSQNAMVLDLTREDQRWVPDGWGTCNLAPLLGPDLTWAHVTGVPDVDRSTTEVPVRVSEGECTGARDPLPFLKEPVLIEDPDQVTVYWTSTPVNRRTDCQGNPFVDSTLTLEEPLGERGLYDGSVYPPRVVVPPGEVGLDPAPAPLDALVLTLTLTPEQPDGIVRSRLTVENRSGNTVTDPGCRATANYSYGAVPVDEPDAALPGRVTTKCLGPRELPAGYDETVAGPTFRIADLPPGDYLASIDFGDARSQRLTAALQGR